MSGTVNSIKTRTCSSSPPFSGKTSLGQSCKKINLAEQIFLRFLKEKGILSHSISFLRYDASPRTYESLFKFIEDEIKIKFSDILKSGAVLITDETQRIFEVTVKKIIFIFDGFFSNSLHPLKPTSTLRAKSRGWFRLLQLTQRKKFWAKSPLRYHTPKNLISTLFVLMKVNSS